MIPGGTRIRQYEIKSLIGEGGMGQVYLAVDHKLERRVAMKFLPPALTADERAVRRLLQEARAAARLDHPNICAIHEIGEDAGRSFLVMPFLEGETLAARMQRGALDKSEAIGIAVQVASALAEAHERGIVHRDIKPQNIMLAPRGQVKVLDFGIAADQGGAPGESEETATRLTVPGTVLGTWPYMCPEQVRGEPLDGRTDIFSLGVVLFEAMWGFHPFKAPSAAEVASNVLTRDPLPVDGPDAAKSPALATIVRRCLEKDRARRYPTAADLIVALEAARSGASAPATPRRRRGALGAAAFLVLIAIAAGTAGVMRWRARPAATAPTSAQEKAAAYDDYIRGKVKLRLTNRVGLDAAIALLQSAVAKDPTLAPAQADLARAYLYKAFEFSGPDDQNRLFEDAEVLIAKALALNPNLAEAYLARGILVWTHARNFPHELAIRAFRRAIELDPNLDEAHEALAVVYLHVGLFDEARGELQRALTINPDNTLARARIGTVAVYSVDYAKAIDLLEAVPEDVNPTYRSRPLADALFRSGRTREAAALVDDFLKRYPSDEGGALTSVRALLLAREGKRDEAEAAIARAIKIGEAAGHFHHTAYNIGCAYAILARPDRAVHWLQVAAGDGFPCYPFYERDETLDGIRSDAGFKAFLGGLKTRWEGFQKLR